MGSGLPFPCKDYKNGCRCAQCKNYAGGIMPFPCKDYNNGCRCEQCKNYDPERRKDPPAPPAKRPDQVNRSCIAGRRIWKTGIDVYHTGVGLIFEDGRRLFIEFEKRDMNENGVIPCDGKVTIFHHRADSPKWYGTGDESEWNMWGSYIFVSNTNLTYDEIVQTVEREGARRRYFVAATDCDDLLGNTNCRTFSRWVLKYVGAHEDQIRASHTLPTKP